MRDHQANGLISGSGIGQLCEKYLSKPCFSYVHLTSSTNSSELLPVPQALAACLKCYKIHGGCSPGWLVAGDEILDPRSSSAVSHGICAWQAAPPGAASLEFTSYMALQCLLTPRVSQALESPPQTHTSAS